MRGAETDAQNESLDREVWELETLLQATLAVDDHIDFESLKQLPRPGPDDPGSLAHDEPAPDPTLFKVSPPTGTLRMIPGAKAKHNAAAAEAEARYQEQCRQHALRREHRLDSWRREDEAHSASNAEAERNAEVDSLSP